MPLGKYVELQRGNTYQGALLGRPGPVLLGLASIARNGGFRADNLKTYGGQSDPRMLLEPGDIYVSLKDVTQSADLLGAVARVPDNVAQGRLTQDTVKLVFKSAAVSRDYIYWVLRTPEYREYCRAHATGTTNLGLPRDDFLAFPVPPPTVRRTSLATILQTLDDKIELNRRMNETLEEMARAIFKDWFVDFGPTRAKMEGRAPYLAPDIWSLFPDRLDDEEIPHGWSGRPIYEIADVIYGAPFASALFNTTQMGTPLIRIRDLVNECPGVWTPENHPKGYKVKQGDIVVGMDGEFRAYLWGGAEAWLNQRVCVFKPKGGYSAAFVRNSIIDPLAHVEATEIATTVIHLGKNDIDRFRVSVPTAEIVEAFNDLAQPLYDQIVENKSEARILAATRDLLLPKLMSGEIRLKDAEKIVGEVV